jgi:hypothetical protein
MRGKICSHSGKCVNKSTPTFACEVTLIQTPFVDSVVASSSGIGASLSSSLLLLLLESGSMMDMCVLSLLILLSLVEILTARLFVLFRECDGESDGVAKLRGESSYPRHFRHPSKSIRACMQPHSVTFCSSHGNPMGYGYVRSLNNLM